MNKTTHASLYQQLCLLGTYLTTAFTGRKVGQDENGNMYYEARRINAAGRKRRWVIYAGTAEATLVPPAWHGWLHYTFDAPLAADSPFQQTWIKPHQPNLTATDAAYRPAGADGGVRAKATGDYQAWRPRD